MLNNTSGFTLLETMIAVAIMTVAFGAILMVQSSSLNTSEKARQMNAVTMLAKSAMVDAEVDFQGKTFNEVNKEKTGQFKEPYQDYTWKREIKEIKFPDFKFSQGGGKDGGDSSGQTAALELLTKVVTNYLSKAIREVTVTISWKRGKGEQKYSVSTYWVDLNHEFTLSP